MASKRKLKKKIAKLKAALKKWENGEIRAFRASSPIEEGQAVYAPNRFFPNKGNESLFGSEAGQMFKVFLAGESIMFRHKIIVDTEGKARHWIEKRDGEDYEGFATQSVLAGQYIEVLVAGDVELLPEEKT